MKKFYAMFAVLALIGAVISGFLVFDHYAPEFTTEFMNCAADACATVSNSPYSKILGIPFSVLGFFFYIWIFFTVVLFFESGAKYARAVAYILLPVAIFGIIFDIYLIGLLIYIRLFCVYCFYTYIVNLAFLITAIAFYKKVKSHFSYGFFQNVRNFFSDIDSAIDNKFAASSYLFLSLFIFLFVITFSFYMNEARSNTFVSLSEEEVFMQNYITSKKESINFAPTPFISGSDTAILDIVVITDPLCIACYGFFGTKEMLLRKYPGKIRFSYYFYPLDVNCNPDMSSTSFSNSCHAVRHLIAASLLTDFDTAYKNLHDSYKKLSEMYRKGIYTQLVFDSYALSEHSTLSEFETLIQSEEVEQILTESMTNSIENSTDATPTFFISGRRLEGAPRPAYFEKIVEYELGL